jgi:hypothetical protein
MSVSRGPLFAFANAVINRITRKALLNVGVIPTEGGPLLPAERRDLLCGAAAGSF